VAQPHGDWLTLGADDHFVANAMARSGGHQLTDAIVSSVALVAGIRVEVVRQTSTHAPVHA
jgi:hypothetical protein